MAEAWLSLGSNMGDRVGLVRRAVDMLGASRGVQVVARSAFYLTPPWGSPDQDDFVNAAVAIGTDLSPQALLDRCLAIENELGRAREGERRWGPRPIDIDLIHYAGACLSTERLTLPHPRWRERAFVLVPLAEIAPDLVVSGERVGDLAEAADRSGISTLPRQA